MCEGKSFHIHAPATGKKSKPVKPVYSTVTKYYQPRKCYRFKFLHVTILVKVLLLLQYYIIISLLLAK